MAPDVRATLGVFRDDGGDDFHHGAFAPSYSPGFGAPRPGGSQGWGDGNGRGLFYDGGGIDTYDGVPERADGVRLSPGRPSTGSGGTFVDGDGGGDDAAEEIVESYTSPAVAD